MPAMLCVYAVVPAGASRGGISRVAARVPGTGIVGERLHVCRAGALAAVVGMHHRKARPTEANLRKHDQILRRVLKLFPAVLPVRFGTYAEDQAALVLRLETQQAPLRRALAQVRHRVQMNVRLAAAADRTDAETISRRSRRGAAISGADYLRQRAAAQRAHELDAVRPAIARWVRMEKVERRGQVVSVYHLIPRRVAHAYRAALEMAAAEQGARLLVTGPWPPYAFVVGSWSSVVGSW